MPHPERSFRRQDAILWEVTGVDAYGEQTLSTPVDLKVRWNTVRRQGKDASGNPITIEADVVVDQVIRVGSLMWKGTYEDFLDTGSGGNNTEVMEVVSYNETPDLKARAVRRQVSLTRYRDQQAELTS